MEVVYEHFRDEIWYRKYCVVGKNDNLESRSRRSEIHGTVSLRVGFAVG